MLKPSGKPTTVFTHMMTDIQRIIVGESPLSPQALQEAAPWRRPSRAKDTTDQGALDFSKRPEPDPAPEPAPKKKRAVDPSEVYTVLSRTEQMKFQKPLEQYIIDDQWDSESINGQNVESRILGVLQNELDGKVFYTVVYIMVHAEGLGNSTFKKRRTTSPTIDSHWSIRTAYFADSRGKIMSLLKRQSQSVAYGRDTRQKPPRLPDKRPRFFILDMFPMENAQEPDVSTMPDIPSARERRLRSIKRDNALLLHGRKLPEYTSLRRYYRLDDLPSPGMARAMGIDLWNKTANKVGASPVELRDIPQSALPDRPEDWPDDAVSMDPDKFTDYYDDEIDEAAQLEAIAEGVEHIFSRRVSSPLLDFNTNAMIERFLTDELDAYDLAEDSAVRALRPSKSLASMARRLEAYLAQTDAYAGADPYIINLAPDRNFPSAFLALIVAARQGEAPFITARFFATDGPSPADASGEVGMEKAIPSLPASAEDILRSWREMADTTLTTMDLRRALRRYKRGLPCDLVEAVMSPRDQQDRAMSTAARSYLASVKRDPEYALYSQYYKHFLLVPSPGPIYVVSSTANSYYAAVIVFWNMAGDEPEHLGDLALRHSTLVDLERTVSIVASRLRDLGVRSFDEDEVRAGLVKLQRATGLLDEAIRIDDDGNTVLDYGADANKKRADGDFKTAFRRSSKKTGKKVKGYQRKLKVTEGYDMQVIGAYSRTKDIPMELMQSIKAGAFNGSEQFTRRTALFMAAILRERGIKPDYLLPLPSRAGFPARLANMLLDYLPGARLLPSPPKAAAVSDVWIPKRRAKARDFYAAYTPPKKTSGTIMIVDDWFVTGASIAAVADRLVMASLDGEIGEIDALYGLVLGVSG